MSTKPKDLLDRIPSVSELLEKPPVRALADRWSRSTVATGLRSFLDELQSDLRQRASSAGMPSARELAERAARYVISLQDHVERPVINATGRISGAPFTGAPLSDMALERMVAFGREFLVSPTEPDKQNPIAISAELASLVCRLTGSPASTAVHSYPGAVWLALASVARRGAVVVARSQMGDVEPGCSLAELATSTGATLREIGATNRTRRSDYETALSTEVGAVLRMWPEGYTIVGESASVDLESLVPLARDRQVAIIDAVGGAPLSDMPLPGDAGRRSARTSLASGADLVIVRGNGLIGGPQCGLLLGQKELIDSITSHPLYATWQLDLLTSAALHGTLEAIASASDSEPALPILELIAASVENLQNRALRIAPQLAHSPGVASAEAIPTRSRLFPAQTEADELASYAISLTPADSDAQSLQRRLASAPQAVVGRVDGNCLILDLRTVFPRQDQALVNAIVGKLSSAPG